MIAKLDLEPGNDDDACQEVGHDLRRFLDRRQSHSQLRNLDLLTWSRHFLPHYFPLPPSAMHIWLASQLDKISANPYPR